MFSKLPLIQRSFVLVVGLLESIGLVRDKGGGGHDSNLSVNSSLSEHERRAATDCDGAFVLQVMEWISPPPPPTLTLDRQCQLEDVVNFAIANRLANNELDSWLAKLNLIERAHVRRYAEKHGASDIVSRIPECPDVDSQANRRNAA